MTYFTTITSKGQITIPKKIRDMLLIGKSRSLSVEFEKGKKEVRITLPLDFLEIAKQIKVKKNIDPVKAREYMETHYERA